MDFIYYQTDRECESQHEASGGESMLFANHKNKNVILIDENR